MGLSATVQRFRSGLAWVSAGSVRMAPVLPLPEILAELGFDPVRVAADAGIGIGRFDDPENTIGFRDLGRLLAHAASVTGCAHLGLLIGQRAGMDALGAIGVAASSAPDLGSALRVIVLYLHLHDRGALLALRRRGDLASLGYVLHLADVPGFELVYDIALGVGREIFRRLIGPGWRPLEVRFCRPRPPDVASYRGHFGSRLRFDSQYTEIVLPASDLDRPLATADAQAHAGAVAALDEIVELTGAGYTERVRRLLRRLLVVDEDPECAHLCQVSELLALHPRTLNRRLRGEGTSFKGLIAQTRFEIARQLLRDTRLPIIEVAAALGYSDATAFIRAFRRASGSSPAAWRSEHSSG